MDPLVDNIWRQYLFLYNFMEQSHHHYGWKGVLIIPSYGRTVRKPYGTYFAIREQGQLTLKDCMDTMGMQTVIWHAHTADCGQ